MPRQIVQKSLPHTFKKFTTQIVYFLVVPFFLLVFAALYTPFHIDSLLDTETTRASYSFNITMVMCILLVVMVISRVVLYLTRAINHMSLNLYRIWCVMEIVVSSFFVALYISLIGHFQKQYLEILVITAAYLFLTLLIPYLFIELAYRFSAVKSIDPETVANDSRIHFYDSRHNLKFVVAADHILYIKADENYITIHYTEAEKMKTYEMRSSMKNIEDICTSNGILRCHRSYFINPTHIKALRKDKENLIVAELDIKEGTLIPVSKTYYEDLVKVL